MTIMQAMQRVNAMLKADADRSNTTYGVLDDRTREALAKLVTIATERVFGKNRGSK